MPAGRSAFGEPRLSDLRLGGEPFQFAVAGMLLPRARRRMVRHQQFDQSVANA